MTNSNANAKSKQGSIKNTNDNVAQEAISQENNRKNRSGARASTKLPNGLTAETGKKVPLDVNNPDFQSKLFELNWYLGIANPIFKPVKKSINVRGSNGDMVSKEITKNEFSHYQYYSVNGTPFEEWVKNQFGEEYLVDDVNNQVYTLVPKEGTTPPTPKPEPESEPNTNDPENN